jgi:capsular polysaccharide biosynthesis protein
VRAHLEANCPAQGPEKVYISRSRLKHPHQRVDQEERIEKLMKASGYTIFHPQRHSIMVQARVYRAAKVIVGGDGSAFHLVPFATEPETGIALIQRRNRPEAFGAIKDQIKAFADVDLVTLNPLTGAQAEKDQPDPIDFRALRRQLGDNGFL